jgi:hypothetical protein
METNRKFLGETFENGCFRPLHFFPALYHLGKQKAVMFVEHFGGVVAIFADSVSMANVLMLRPYQNPYDIDNSERGAYFITEILEGGVSTFALPSPSLVSVDQEV